MKRSRSEQADTNFTAEDIKRIVMEIVCAAGMPKDKEIMFRKRHPDFAERYPALFLMACEPNFDMRKLSFMLDMMSKIDKQETTLDAASKEVGQTLFDEYVAPILPNAQTKE
jgi:hypothetical protein